MPSYAVDRLLDDVARAIVADDRSFEGFNDGPGLLEQLFRSSSNRAETAQHLASLVERHSAGRRTIRRADSSLFASQTKGPNLYLVCCSTSVDPDEIVTELTDGMVLVSFGPRRNGLTIGAEQASPERVRLCRELAARAKIRAQGEEIAKEFIAKLITALRTILIAQGKNTAAENIGKALGHKTYDLKEIAVMCVVNDISFDEVVLDAIAS